MDGKVIGKITRNFAVAGWIFIFLFVVGIKFPIFFALGFLVWGVGAILFFFNVLSTILLVICRCKNTQGRFYIKYLILSFSFIIIYPIFFCIVLRNSDSIWGTI